MRERNKKLIPVALIAMLVIMPVWCQEKPDRLITPLTEPPGAQQSDVGSQANQCAGTMEKYLFPPTGYEPSEPDSRSAKGKSLYDQNNCVQCHAISGNGGELGPPLDGIGGHRGRDWLIARLLDPEKQMKDFPGIFGGAPNIMPHLSIKKRDAAYIADYLLTLPEPKGGFSVEHHVIDERSEPHKPGDKQWRPSAKSEASRSGKELFSALHCGACHSVDGANDRFGPDLAGIGSRMSGKRLEKVLSGAVRSSVMKEQAEQLGDERIYDLKAFLLTLPKKEPSAKTKYSR